MEKDFMHIGLHMTNLHRT